MSIQLLTHFPWREDWKIVASRFSELKQHICYMLIMGTHHMFFPLGSMDRIVSDCSTEYAWVVSGVRHPSGKSVSITISLRVVLSTFICVCMYIGVMGHTEGRR